MRTFLASVFHDSVKIPVLLVLVAGNVLFTGCDDEEKSNLQSKIDQEKLRAEAYQTDAAKARELAQREKEAADRMRLEVEQLQQQIDDLKGLKQLSDLGIKITRNNRGEVTVFDLLGLEDFSNDQIQSMRNFKSVQEVLMTGQSIDETTFDILADLPNLRSLEVSVSGTNTACLKKLAGLKNLTFLQLKRTSVNDESMKVLSTFPRLQQIRVGQTKVGDEGLKHLKNLKSLVALDLTDCNKVSDAGLEYIADLPRLKMLKVWGKGITNKGLESIGKMSNLEVLGMNDTRIDDEGMFAINGLTKLKEVYFARTAVADFGIMQLTGATRMKKMVLRDTNITDEGLKFVGKMLELETLDLSECSSPGPTDLGMEYLIGLPRLKDLNLWSTKAGDGAVTAISQMKNVVRLNLDATQITDNSLSDLGKMEQLTWLHIGSTKITDKQVAQLYGLKNLTYINLSFTEASFSDDVFDIYDRLKESLADGCTIVGLN